MKSDTRQGKKDTGHRDEVDKKGDWIYSKRQEEEQRYKDKFEVQGNVFTTTKQNGQIVQEEWTTCVFVGRSLIINQLGVDLLNK